MFKGCLVALVTPFRDGVIDHRSLEELVDRLIAGGVDGLVPCGTTGESPTLSAQEREEVIATVIRQAKGLVPVIAGTGTNATEASLANSLAAARAGADGVMLVTPYYNKPNQTGLYEHFSYVAGNLDLPVILYNVPGRAGVEISVETIARLREHHPNIVAVKHATGSIDGASALSTVSDIAIISGDDTLTLPLMSIGAVGVISVVANLLPHEASSLTGAALSGDWEAARTWHRRLFPVANELLRLDTNPIPIKTALAIRGMIAEEFRLPMCPLDETKRHRLEALLEAEGTKGPRDQGTGTSALSPVPNPQSPIVNRQSPGAGPARPGVRQNA